MKIIKNAVIGYVITRTPDKIRDSISCIPVFTNFEGIEDNSLRCSLSYSETVLAVLPAIPGTFAVYCDYETEGSVDRFLGFEIPGSYHPDWEEQMKEQA